MRTLTNIVGVLLICLVTSTFFFQYVSARGGGGSSGGGGHSSGGGSHSSSHSGDSSGGGELPCVTFKECRTTYLIWFTVYASIFGAGYFRKKKYLPESEQNSTLKKVLLAGVEPLVFSLFLSLLAIGYGGFFGFLIMVFLVYSHLIKKPSGETNFLSEKISDEEKEKIVTLFLSFQNAWSSFDNDTLKKLLTPLHYERIALELLILKKEGRKNIMENISVDRDMRLVSKSEDGNTFSVNITASAKDTLLEVMTDEKLFCDSVPFTEIWAFTRQGEALFLDAIHQIDEEVSIVSEIKDWAASKSFFYNPDFGRLMLPNKGVLFKKPVFGVTDINNHCIGNYKNNVIELYTIDLSTESYLVGQTILPKEYKNVLIRRKKFFSTTPSGLIQWSLESTTFNDEFEVYYAEGDNIAMLELLNPAFMEYIMRLPFILNIELVGNFLYFYTKDIAKADYDKLLEILSRAFEEMKM